MTEVRLGLEGGLREPTTLVVFGPSPCRVAMLPHRTVLANAVGLRSKGSNAVP